MRNGFLINMRSRFRPVLSTFVTLSLFASSPYASAGQVSDSARVKYVYRKFETAQEQIRGVKTAQEMVSLFGESMTSKEKDYFLKHLNGKEPKAESLLKGTQVNLGNDGKLTVFQTGKRVAIVEIVDLASQIARINGKPFHYRPYASTITMFNEILEILEAPSSSVAQGWPLPAKLFFLLGEQSAHAGVGSFIKKAGGLVWRNWFGKAVIAIIVLHLIASALVCPFVTQTREQRDSCSSDWSWNLIAKAWDSVTHLSEHTFNAIRDASLYIKGPTEMNITGIQCRQPARKAEDKINSYGVAVKTPGGEGFVHSGATFSIPAFQLKGSLLIKPETMPPSMAFTFVEDGNNKGEPDSEVTIPLDKNLKPQETVMEASGPVGWSGQGNALKNAHFATDILEICKDEERVAKVNARLSSSQNGLKPSELKSAVQ